MHAGHIDVDVDWYRKLMEYNAYWKKDSAIEIQNCKKEERMKLYEGRQLYMMIDDPSYNTKHVLTTLSWHDPIALSIQLVSQPFLLLQHDYRTMTMFFKFLEKPFCHRNRR
jgi:hypothetical protein